ncbi:BCL-6 corepressor-like protein 1 [Clytia hemisphaerica]|uniref:Uncharacterized protein n=1 Tax=Clytia hemisphaerica TaxID=252671 RepID=A0A7M5UJ84_9CNID|eukprot:TCONS_00046748-protein
MIKVKDAFRRIGPSSAPVKRKDTPVPLRESNVSPGATKMLDKQRCKKSDSNSNIISEESEIKEENSTMYSKKMDNDQGLHQRNSNVVLNGVATIKEESASCQSLQPLDSNVLQEQQTEDVFKISESMSSPQIQASIDDTVVRSPPKARRSQGRSLRKNSGQKTRSAEDLTLLSNRSGLDSNDQKTTNVPLHRHRRVSNKSKRKIIAQSYEPNKLLEKAIEEGYSDLVESLITSGQVNINKLNGSGKAPLHLAAFEGKDDIVKILLKHGAYIDILSNTGLTALQAAVMEGNFDSAQLLISNGADQGFVLDGPLNPRVSRDWSVT